MRVLANGKFIARDGGDTWPTPMYGKEGNSGLEWRLRYANDEQYRADPESAAMVERWKADPNFPQIKWRPSIHMRRIHSRISVRITEVRCERLQDLSEADAKAEGAAFTCSQCGNDLDDENGAEVHAACDRESDESAGYMIGYRRIWERINGAGSWDRNDWVWAVSFERLPR